MSMTGDAAALAVIAALMLGYYWAQWRRAGAANRAARAAVNAAGRQAWRARGVIVLVGAVVFAVIDLWLRGRDGDIAVRSHRPSELILIRDHRPRALCAATQVDRPVGLSASDRDSP